MEFYFSPERRQEVERKLDRLFKHVEHKPKITFGNVEQIVKTTIYDCGVDGRERHKTKIQATKVEIEDIQASKWILVATVDYRNGLMLMCDARYFKNIPSQYGLEYVKCDHCGSTHRNRTESHILYNYETEQWMQVGSTCVNKMIDGGKYLNGLMLKLYDYIKLFGGCDGDEWFGGGWRPSKKYLYEGIPIDEALAVCLAFMDEHGREWQKAEWGQWGKEVGGTNDALISEMDGEVKTRVDEQLFKSVKEYFLAMERGEDDPLDGASLTQKIIDAFNNDFIALCEMYIAWFAINIYQKHLETADFEQLVRGKGVEKGLKIDICGKLLAQNRVHDEYSMFGDYYDTAFEDQTTGLTFKKNLSSKDTINAFLCEDGFYRFNADVKYVALKGCYVGLGGRLRKQKKANYVKQ